MFRNCRTTTSPLFGTAVANPAPGSLLLAVMLRDLRTIRIQEHHRKFEFAFLVSGKLDLAC